MNKAITLGLLFVLLGACATTDPVPEDRFYRVERIQAKPSLGSPVLQGGLSVDYVQADPLRSGRAVIFSFRDRPLELHRYRYDFWVDQPPRLIHRALMGYLRDSRVADAVSGAGGSASTTYRLRLRLLRFEQILEKQSTGAEAEITLQATLLKGPGEAILWTRTYSHREFSDSRGMHGTALAMQAAIGGIFSALQADLMAVNTPQP